MKKKGLSWLKRIWFNWAYLTKPRWDSGIPAPELQTFITDRNPGKALDLGCGTGTNAIYLASQGWYVDGVDFSPLAIHQGRKKLRKQFRVMKSQINFFVGDVTRLDRLALNSPFDLIYDIGCLHALGNERAAMNYVKGVRHAIKPGGFFLLYAHQPEEEPAAFPEHGLTKRWVTGCSRRF